MAACVLRIDRFAAEVNYSVNLALALCRQSLHIELPPVMVEAYIWGVDIVFPDIPHGHHLAPYVVHIVNVLKFGGAIYGVELVVLVILTMILLRKSFLVVCNPDSIVIHINKNIAV